MVVAIFGVVFIVWVGRSLPDLVDPRGKPIGYDFMAFWSAARLALDLRPEAAFDGAAIAAVQHAAVPFLPNIWFPWHYPPIFLLAVAPLGLLPYPAALALFVVGSAALWAALVHQILPDRRAWIVAAAAPAGLITVLDGQNALLTAALAGFALLWLDRRPLAAGILIGLLAVKPHLALLFPLALLAEGRWRSIAAAAATVLALAAASLLAFGWSTWAAFLHHLPLTQAMADSGAVPWGTMPSPYVFALSLGAPVMAARILQGAAALFAAICVWRAWRNRSAAFEAKAATLIAGSLLVSPYLFYYDLTWAALAIAWLALLGLRTGFHRGEREILLFAWLAPALMPPVHLVTALQLGFPAVLLLLLVAVRRADSDEHLPARAEWGSAPLARWRAKWGEVTPTPAMLMWVALAALVAFDGVMCRRLGWGVTNWAAPTAPFAVLAVVALGYGLSGRSPGLASTASWFLAWTLFSLAGVVLSYIGAASGRPPYDAVFERFDLALGFAWPSWFEFVVAHPVLQVILAFGYASMMAQVVLSVLYFCWRGAEHKNAELMLNAFVGTLLTIAGFAALPGFGPIYGVPPLLDAYDSYLTELIALRDGTFVSLDLSHLKGIIVFPSLHTVMAIVLTHIHRQSRLLVPALLLNGLMLLSIPIIGGHYLADEVAGAVIAGVTILLTGPIRRRLNAAAPAAG